MNVENRTLFIADNLDILRGIDSETIDLIYLDPPEPPGQMVFEGLFPDPVDYSESELQAFRQETPAVRQPRGQMQRLSNPFPLSEHHHRPHCPAVKGRLGRLGQPATPVRGVQFGEREPFTGSVYCQTD